MSSYSLVRTKIVNANKNNHKKAMSISINARNYFVTEKI